MTAYESSGDDGSGSDHEGAFVDGVVDTYERIAAVHGGRPLTKAGQHGGARRASTTSSRSPSAATSTRSIRTRRRSCRWRWAPAGR